MNKKLTGNNKVEGAQLSFSSKEIETIRRTVAEKANDDEFRMFMHLAKSYGLDPFNGEIFFWKLNGKPNIMTSRDGYLRLADKNPAYDGLVSDVIRSNDVFKREKDDIKHEYGADRGDIIGAYALVYREDRRYPIYVFAPFEEYNAGTRVWNSYPSSMILKVAESMALKRAFTVSGLVSREEMDVIQTRDESDKEKSKLNSPVDKEEVIDVKKDKEETAKENNMTRREKEIKSIVGESKELKKDMFSYLKFAKEDLKLADDKKLKLADLTANQYKELKDLLLNMKDRKAQITA